MFSLLASIFKDKQVTKILKREVVAGMTMQKIQNMIGITHCTPKSIQNPYISRLVTIM